MNKVIMVGAVATDPKAYTTNNGKVSSKFRIGVQRRFNNAQGVRESDFFDVVAWGKTAEFCNNYLIKGRRVSISGSIQTRSYDAQDGTKRYVTEIIADEVEGIGGRENAESRPAEAPNVAPMPGNSFTEVDPGDDLPF